MPAPGTARERAAQRLQQRLDHAVIAHAPQRVGGREADVEVRVPQRCRQRRARFRTGGFQRGHRPETFFPGAVDR